MSKQTFQFDMKAEQVARLLWLCRTLKTHPAAVLLDLLQERYWLEMDKVFAKPAKLVEERCGRTGHGTSSAIARDLLIRSHLLDEPDKLNELVKLAAARGFVRQEQGVLFPAGGKG